MLWQCCTQYASKFGKHSSGHRTGKGQFSFQSQRKAMPKNVQFFYCTIALISQANKVMLKILQARLQQYVNWVLSDIQAGFRKGRGTRDQIANIHWITEKAKEFQKNIYFCFIDYEWVGEVAQLCPTLCNPVDCSPPRLLLPWGSPGKNTGVGCHLSLWMCESQQTVKNS